MLDIPIKKKVTVAQIVKSHNYCLKTKIEDQECVGTDFYLLRKDLAPKGFINRLESLENQKIMPDDSMKTGFWHSNYAYTEENIETYEILDTKSIGKKIQTIKLKIRVNKNIERTIYCNYNYYSYFKKLGMKFKFRDSISPIAVLKDDEIVGIMLPIRVKE